MKHFQPRSLAVLLSIFFLTLVVACSSSPKAPDVPVSASVPAWANNPQASYPDTRYLSAVGTGNSRNEAIEDAKKQLAESFVVKVQSETKAKGTSSIDESTSGAVSGSANTGTEKSLSLQTETYLRGAEVKEVAKVGSDYYALVAVDKLQARSGLLLEANKIKASLDQDLSSLEQMYTTEKMNQAKAEFQSLGQLYGEASALGMSALIDVAPYEARMNKIQNDMRNKNAKIIFAVKTVKGENYFEHDIQSCINDRGGVMYAYDQAPQNANKVQISVEERPQHLPVAGWTKIRFDLTAAVVQNDGRMYRVQVTQTETGRSRDAVLESVADKLSHDFCESLFNRMNEIR